METRCMCNMSNNLVTLSPTSPVTDHGFNCQALFRDGFVCLGVGKFLSCSITFYDLQFPPCLSNVQMWKAQLQKQ